MQDTVLRQSISLYRHRICGTSLYKNSITIASCSSLKVQVARGSVEKRKYLYDTSASRYFDAMKFAPSVLILVTFSLKCVIGVSEGSEESFPRVNTLLGAIEGHYKTSSHGIRYEAYEGIPYAHPPTGESRFGVARSISSWSGVLMAKQFGPPCMQYAVYERENVQGSEDCLYMNIYTPIADDLDREVNGTEINLHPVIFYIHGGAFQWGNSRIYGAQFLLNENVTLVTINYRVGPLGFLSTEDEVVPGNMGLKDQVIALRWVKDNIRSFRGDPSRITIFGQSAGGASVHYHYLTNLTTGLFQSGMSLSGTALNCWAQTENSLKNAQKLATIVGCGTKNVQSMIDCLRSRPAHQIVGAVEKFMSWMNHPTISFGPVVERGGGEFTFIDQPPIDIITSGKAHDVPWITGVLSEEGLCCAGAFATNETLLEELNDRWETIAPDLFVFNNTVRQNDVPKVVGLIKQHYLGTSPISRSTFNQTVQMIGDRLFVYSAAEAAKIQAQANQSPVRFYYFTYRGAHSFSEALSGSSENFGVAHTDDEVYLLGSLFDPTTTPQDLEMQKQLVKLWVSFAAEGTPNVDVDWPALNRSSDELNYLHISGPDEMAMKTSRNFGQKSFWHSIGF